MLVACQLGDDKDPPKCEKGFHVVLESCQPDTVAQIQVTITAADGGTSCTGDPAAQRPPTLEPETVHVKVGEEFQFTNLDTIEHEIRGTDGTAWLSVKPNARSAFTSITKTGSFGYRVSGCAKGGTVSVDP